MKNRILASIIAALLFTGTKAQLPFTYSVDSTSFNALAIEGGMTQAHFTDINKDGNLDIVTIGDHGSPNVNASEHGITVFFGNGTGGGWSLFQNGAFGYGGSAVGDLNNDGKQDIAYSMHHNYGGPGGTQLIEAQTGDGTGMNWTPYDGGLASNGESYGMFGTDIADVNNDGWLDIGSNSFGAGKGIHIYKNNQNGTWTQTYGANPGNTGHYIQFGDMDGDGNMDFVASNQYGSAYFGNGTGTFTMKTAGLLPVSTYPYVDVSLFDIDNDGDDDFIFTNKDYSSSISGVYVYSWNRTTQQWVDHSSGLPTSASDKYSAARAADIDMDGFADIVLTSDVLDEVQIWKGNGGSSWTKVWTFKLPALMGAEEIAIADIDRSGYPDILVWGSFLGGGIFTPTSYNKIKLFRDKVVPNSVNANLLYPKGSECWHNNSVRFINWASAVPANHASKAKIEYSTAGTSGPWTVIAAAAPNNGTYQWNVPASVSSSACHIRVTVTDNVSSATAVAMNSIPFNIGCSGSTTGVGETEVLQSVSVFPNPSSGVFICTGIEMPTLGNAELRVQDLLGRNVSFGISGIDELHLDMQNNPNGVYFMDIRSSGSARTVKLILER